MKNLPLNAIRAFALVYQTGGIRQAARQLTVSHSSVSRHVKLLEDWLGVPLLAPNGKRHRVSLTPQGERFGKACVNHLGAVRSEALALQEASHANTVKISTTASVAVRWLLPRLADLQDAHPHIEISVITERSISDPAEQGAHMALRMGAGPGETEEGVPLMDDLLYPVMHPKLLETVAAGKVFSAYTLLHDRDPATPWSDWFAEFPLADIDPQKGPRFSSSDLVLRAAARGLGVGLARHRLAFDDVSAGVLVRPFGEQHLFLKDAYWIITSRKAPLTTAARQVRDWLLAQAKSEAADG